MTSFDLEDFYAGKYDSEPPDDGYLYWAILVLGSVAMLWSLASLAVSSYSVW